MKKHLTSLILIVLLFSLFSVSAFAQTDRYIYDLNGTLSSEELRSLEERAEKVSYTYNVDTAVFFIDTFGNLEAGEYCDKLWHDYGFSNDCVMLVVATGERAYFYYACGLGSAIQTDYGSEYIDAKVLPTLRQENYYKAAGEFITYSAEFCNHYYQTGSAYDVNDRPSELRMLIIKIFGNTGIGLLIAGVPLRKQKKAMNSVVAKVNASDYIRAEGLRLTARNDNFLNHHVTRVPIPRVESHSGEGGHGGGTTMHTSSSGHSYSGHGGHF